VGDPRTFLLSPLYYRVAEGEGTQNIDLMELVPIELIAEVDLGFRIRGGGDALIAEEVVQVECGVGPSGPTGCGFPLQAMVLETPAERRSAVANRAAGRMGDSLLQVGRARVAEDGDHAGHDCRRAPCPGCSWFSCLFSYYMAGALLAEQTVPAPSGHVSSTKRL